MFSRSSRRCAVASILILLMAPGCSSWRVTPLAPEATIPQASDQSGPLEVRRTDGTKLKLHDWTLAGDTLRGSTETWVAGARVLQPEMLLLSQIDRRPRPLGTMRVSLSNGTKVELKDVVVDGDSLRGRVSAPGSNASPRRMVIARRDVVLIEQDRTDVVRTAGLVLGIATAAVLTIAAILGANTK